eukprot:scaffold421212_cov46-Attheya_sp.AAC.1
MANVPVLSNRHDTIHAIDKDSPMIDAPLAIVMVTNVAALGQLSGTANLPPTPIHVSRQCVTHPVKTVLFVMILGTIAMVPRCAPSSGFFVSRFVGLPSSRQTTQPPRHQH